MLDTVLLLLRDVVAEYLKTTIGGGPGSTEVDKLVFMNSDRAEHVEFPSNAVTLLLVNVEEEVTLRPADPYRHSMHDGTVQRVSPPLHLALSVLLVANFKDYASGLRYLSAIVQYFQSHRVLDGYSAPALSPLIEKITIDLQTLSLTELAQLWGVLRSAYRPSLLYKVRLVVVQDPDGAVQPAGQGAQVRTGEM